MELILTIKRNLNTLIDQNPGVFNVNPEDMTQALSFVASGYDSDEKSDSGLKKNNQKFKPELVRLYDGNIFYVSDLLD